MHFTHEIAYDASLDQVHAMLADPDFRRASAAAQGVVKADVTITPSGEGMRVVVDQVQETAGVPSFARKVVGDTTRAIQTEEWSSATAATITIETPGKPVRLQGTLSLVEEGGRTVERMDADLTVKVPLVGGKMEKLMADLITKGMDREHGAGITYLQQHPGHDR